MEHREEIRAQSKAYYAEHKAEAAAYSRAYRATHKEEMLETQRRYLQTPEGKEKNRRATHIRKARLRAAPHTFSLKDWQAALNYFENRCAYCGIEDVPLEQEHVVPLVRGGGYVAGNIVPACARCNGSKRTDSPEHWAASCGAAFVQTGAIERIQAYRLGVLDEA